MLHCLTGEAVQCHLTHQIFGKKDLQPGRNQLLLNPRDSYVSTVRLSRIISFSFNIYIVRKEIKNLLPDLSEEAQLNLRTFILKTVVQKVTENKFWSFESFLG